jgi:hypothetical protein
MHHGLRSVALVATIAGLAAPPRTHTSELRTRMAQRPKRRQVRRWRSSNPIQLTEDLKEQ